MDTQENIVENEETQEMEEAKELDFACPNCGERHQDDIVFLCNRCDTKEMIKKNGVYICPQCLVQGQNFMCMVCDSKDVILKSGL